MVYGVYDALQYVKCDMMGEAICDVYVIHMIWCMVYMMYVICDMVHMMYVICDMVGEGR